MAVTMPMIVYRSFAHLPCTEEDMRTTINAAVRRNIAVKGVYADLCRGNYMLAHVAMASTPDASCDGSKGGESAPFFLRLSIGLTAQAECTL